MNALFRKAILAADEVRMQLIFDIYQPVNIFDLCMKLGLTVRFIDINMEGLYVKNKDGTHPTILLSSQRPLPRRCFTCAHELGHHIFNHGFKIDALSEQDTDLGSSDTEELLVNSFAGALLMPVAGIRSEFAKRDWLFQKASPLEFYTICSVFGTGYQTLILHCRANKIIDDSKASSLLKFTPVKMFKGLFPQNVKNSYFKIVDNYCELSIIDLEVSNYIILPHHLIVEGDHLKEVYKTSIGTGYVTVKSGIVRVASVDASISFFIRIQNAHYVGLAENRHLENSID
ncbi:MAG TPA: ImmA/IrrE family metallo-endopeptidase [Puia sp.]|jgi:hypothetical protein|nr:ImmA/IrrE family metallo-endopeptidase [Puia sp.]